MRDDASDDESKDEERTVLTARLMLRWPGTEDKAAMDAAMANPHVAVNLITPAFAHWQGGGGQKLRLAFGRREAHLIGASVYQPSATRPNGHELSFFVAERHWGHGFGTEIAHATIDDAFSADDIERLWCDIRVTNGAARRVVEKCGFQFRDTGMVRSLAARGAVPVERFVLERRVWQSLKAWGATDHIAPAPAGPGSVGPALAGPGIAGPGTARPIEDEGAIDAA